MSMKNVLQFLGFSFLIFTMTWAGLVASSKSELNYVLCLLLILFYSVCVGAWVVYRKPTRIDNAFLGLTLMATPGMFVVLNITQLHVFGWIEVFFLFVVWGLTMNALFVVRGKI